jgi:HD-GYP domain-containing protein (c-di-GMP phosphodiesterase class II)
MLAALSSAVEAREPYTRGHAHRVTGLATTVARDLGWDERRVASVELAGVLHDVGKLAVPARVLRKPASLTDAERAEIRVHPAAGARLIAPIARARAVRPYVLHHHERWDGEGYPGRLAGTDIPIEARLLAIADAFDAMTTTRAYRAAMAPDDAVVELERCAGSQFDPGLVEAFVAVWGKSPAAASA